MTATDPAGLRPIHHAALAAGNGWRAETFGESVNGIPLQAWWPTTERPTRVVWAAIHGEEAVTMQLAHQLLRTVHADDACAVVVPVLNPDGVLGCTRQNARGVDLNRNFPSESWRPEPSPTFWPTSIVRTTERRTMRSSPGDAPGSEPETQAIMTLVDRVDPEFVIDLHTPLECVLALTPRGLDMARHLAEPAGLRVVEALAAPTFGDSGAWCESRGSIAVTYELELAPLPTAWARHVDALTRCVVERR
ncbi:MAG: peptidase carboxypeptidase [Thermoleophilia bacterium]|nr:peptidase carboxypeptidase [Thermoleophilia bacterium]